MPIPASQVPNKADHAGEDDEDPLSSEPANSFRPSNPSTSTTTGTQVREAASALTGLQCHLCKATYQAEALYVCDKCLGPLEPVYNYAAVRVTREEI